MVTTFSSAGASSRSLASTFSTRMALPLVSSGIVRSRTFANDNTVFGFTRVDFLAMALKHVDSSTSAHSRSGQASPMPQMSHPGSGFGAQALAMVKALSKFHN